METVQRNVVVLGWNATGKTGICKRFVGGTQRFDDGYVPTYENSFAKVYRHKGQDVELFIKDTQGLNDQELFRNEYGLGFHGYILVYNVRSKRSFDALKTVNQKLVNLTGTNKVPRVLVGNKAEKDMPASERQVPTGVGRALAEDWGCAFTECSAASNFNTENVFKLLLDEIEEALLPTEDDSHMNCLVTLFRRCFEAESSPSLILKLVTNTLTICTFAFGLSLLILGVAIGLQTATSGGASFGYIAFGFGLVTVVLSVLGRYGVYKQNRELIRTFSVSLIALVLIELTVVFMTFNTEDAIKHHQVLAFTWAGLGWILQCLGSWFAFKYQRKLQQLQYLGLESVREQQSSLQQQAAYYRMDP